MMSTIERSIEVEAPLRIVYNQWTEFEEFPRFMEGVREVWQLADRRRLGASRSRRRRRSEKPRSRSKFQTNASRGAAVPARRTGGW
jgi:uncharacterized membrane protein